MRPVPRNIDRPNRTAEYIGTFLGIYYSLMFTVNEPSIAILSAGGGVYLVYKLTLNKPEGAAYRVWYRFAGLGKMLPSAKKAKKFEI